MGEVKKPNRAARMKKKAEHAETFEKGFSMGYNMGYNQAIKDEQLKRQLKRGF